ncbi:hypothetical protein ACJ73_04596 [Blastomyces percursus]|uniref:Uncharacterized protein n=1 Tax=Blastomyces percursus TaxID=1658174 RepID=A0A1J9Q5P8_9EURO|nr:hypothetical protein ACJ73_04596 [Blastomyces percursus]
MPKESKAAQAYRAAESRVRSWSETEAKAYEHWQSANGRLMLLDLSSYGDHEIFPEIEADEDTQFYPMLLHVENPTNAALADDRSHKTIRKAQNYESNARDKYEDARAEKHHAEKLRDEALRRLEIEEAASHRLGGDVGVMIGENAYGYKKPLYR